MKKSAAAISLIFILTACAPAQQPVSHVLPPADSIAQRLPVFLIDLEGKGGKGNEIGCGDRLVSVEHTVIAADSSASSLVAASLNELFSLKQSDLDSVKLYSALMQSSLNVVDVSVDNGIATVHLTGTVQLGGVCDDPRFKGQIEETIKVVPTVKEVKIFLNGSEEEYNKVGDERG